MLDVDSGTLSPLPGYLHRGLLAVATLGLLSFVCSSVLFLYLTFRLVSWRRKPGVKAPPINQFLFLVYNLLLADIQQGIGFCLNITALKNNAIQVGTSMCFAQGWLLSTGDLSSSLFICAIAIHTYFGVVRDYKLPSVPFYFCIAAIWTFTYTMALVGPLIHTHDFYVRASAWCWINDAYQTDRLWFHYFWILLCLFGTVAIYTLIFITLSRRTRERETPCPILVGATPLMVLYPIVYTVCTAPLAVGRIAAVAGHQVSVGYFCIAGAVIACNGWLDVLLYTSTRANIMFTADAPSENIGLETFAFMGKGHKFGTVTTVEAGMNRTRRAMMESRSGESAESDDKLYGLDEIRVHGEVTVSVDHRKHGFVRYKQKETPEMEENSWEMKKL